MGTDLFRKSKRFNETCVVDTISYKVLKAREGELSWLKKNFVRSSISIFVTWLTPMMITAVIFTTYILTGNEMTATTAFTLVSTVNIFQVNGGNK